MEFQLYLEAGAGDSHSLSSRCFQSWPQTPFPSLDCKNTNKTVRLLDEVCEELGEVKEGMGRMRSVSGKDVYERKEEEEECLSRLNLSH